MIVFGLWSLFTSAPAGGTVPGTHPVEYTLKSAAALHADYPCHLSFGTFSTLY